MTTTHFIMAFIVPLIIGIVSTFAIMFFVKEYSPKENQRNTSLLLNIADDDEIGILMLGYLFSWINAFIGWGVFLLMTIDYLTDTIKPV
jgi:hypothetical protein